MLVSMRKEKLDCQDKYWRVFSFLESLNQSNHVDKDLPLASTLYKDLLKDKQDGKDE